MTQVSVSDGGQTASPPCPIAGCREMLRRVGERWKCPRHPETPFAIEEFTPIPLQISQADAATEEHALCAHHPEHRAGAICAGTGNYICSLCTVEIDGNTYSVQFLDSPAGRSVVAGRFTSVLPRPDRMVWHMLACFLIVPITFVMLFSFFIWVPIGLVNWIRALRLRRRSALYRRIVRIPHMTLMLLGLIIWLVLGILLVMRGHWTFNSYGS